MILNEHWGTLEVWQHILGVLAGSPGRLVIALAWLILLQRYCRRICVIEEKIGDTGSCLLSLR